MARTAVLAVTVALSCASIGFSNDSGSATHDDSVLTFNGEITPESVRNFKSAHSTKPAKKLVVSSTGGDIGAAIELGKWVWSRGLDVEVYVLCQSACANYVFPAGNKKIIGENALVLWHGSIEQKNLREELASYQTQLIQYLHEPKSVSASQVEQLKSNRLQIESMIRLKELQARFFDQLEVNEFITRLGQEPIRVESDSWTTTVKVMEKFGIKNVEAPKDYGSISYINKIKTSGIYCGGNCTIFDLDATGRTIRLTK